MNVDVPTVAASPSLLKSRSPAVDREMLREKPRSTGALARGPVVHVEILVHEQSEITETPAELIAKIEPHLLSLGSVYEDSVYKGQWGLPRHGVL